MPQSTSAGVLRDDLGDVRCIRGIIRQVASIRRSTAFLGTSAARSTIRNDCRVGYSSVHRFLAELKTGDTFFATQVAQRRASVADLVELTASEIEQGYAGGCPACLEMGSEWVHLRVCLVCRNVGCCDDSPQTHARAHWQETSHAVIRSLEPDEPWRWNYETEQELA